MLNRQRGITQRLHSARHSGSHCPQLRVFLTLPFLLQADAVWQPASSWLSFHGSNPESPNFSILNTLPQYREGSRPFTFKARRTPLLAC